MHFAIGRLFYEENREMVPGKSSQYKRIRNIEVRYMEKSASFVKFSTSAFGDGPRNFEPWSSDEDDKCRAGTLLS
ncbi:hypothetical protein TNCV_3054101 [Trichonephila clavipes]|nr:hypothetical protein TNCV_3054101 [Trichonephila clavipes]